MGRTNLEIAIDVSELDPAQVPLATQLCTAVVATLAATHPTTAPTPAVRVHGWDEDMASGAMSRLEAHGGRRDKVLRAIVDAGGSISREEVLDACGFDATRNMTGFTKPVKGVLREMVLRGELPVECEKDTHVSNPMRPHYANGPGKFTHLFMEPELAELFQRALAN